MRVEIWGDVVCPWCYIGNARFEQALDGFEHRDEVQVVHRSFELDPNRPRGQVESVGTMLAQKFGPRAAAMEDKVATLARSEGLGYTTDREVGSTLDAHRLLQFAKEHGLQDRLLDILFEANFAQGDSVFTAEALVRHAQKAGLDPDEARRVLDDPNAHLAAVRADEREAAQLGATGVPFFVIDRRYAVSGGQPAQAFSQALQTAWADRPLISVTGNDADADAAGVCGPDGSCEVPGAAPN